MSTPSEPPPFLASDAWILLSILYLEKGTAPARLADIIAAADFIDHAIVTRGELETGLARLTAAGYVTRDGQGFAATDVVRSFWATTGSHARTVAAARNAVATFLGASDWTPGPIPEATSEDHVSKAEYVAALRSYQDMMRRRSRPG